MEKPDLTAPKAANAVSDGPVGTAPEAPADAGRASKRPREIGGPSGLEPTRYGDWERNGRVSDF